MRKFIQCLCTRLTNLMFERRLVGRLPLPRSGDRGCPRAARISHFPSVGCISRWTWWLQARQTYQALNKHLQGLFPSPFALLFFLNFVADFLVGELVDNFYHVKRNICVLVAEQANETR